MSVSREEAAAAKAWPFKEAQQLAARVGDQVPDKGYVLFETGYGSSGLPHIGTFAEVVRTTMVRNAFSYLSDIPTKLFAFSDDMDGFRKVPDNVPEQEMLTAHLGKPVSSVPDPFGTHESFGAHNNARLRAFLDEFGFDYEFQSSADCYKSGRFDQALLSVLRNYDKVINVILPTLGEERRRTYSPFLPISQKTGQVLQVPVVERDIDAGTIVYKDEDGALVETPVTGGHCKLQWKADWAMRWAALDVDYEMSGKDLIESVKLSSKICRILGGKPPEGFTYELFLDDKGEKISKSRGNGLTVEEWLRYAPPESLSLFMFQQPRRAKKLYFDSIPKAVDEYITFLEKLPHQDGAEQAESPAWHIHQGDAPNQTTPLSFGLLLNLASVCNAEDKSVLWGFISRYASDVTPDNCPLLDRLAGYAVTYFQDFVKPSKQFRAPSTKEKAALGDLNQALSELSENPSPEEIQSEIYEIGKRHEFEALRDWFRALYEVLLGQSQGPRMGSFIALYGISESRALIEDALNR
jgi:lysyl-tRNA synthetase class 1